MRRHGVRAERRRALVDYIIISSQWIVSRKSYKYQTKEHTRFPGFVMADDPTPYDCERT